MSQTDLLDYWDIEAFARENHIPFRNRAVSQLECNELEACCHLSGEEIDAEIATSTDDIVALPDGGQPSPTLPQNWQSVSQPNQWVFQRVDRDHYIVLGDGVDEWIVVLCSQVDRAYPAPLASQTVTVDGDTQEAIGTLAMESNDLIEPQREGD